MPGWSQKELSTSNYLPRHPQHPFRMLQVILSACWNTGFPPKRALGAHVEPKHPEVPLGGDLLVGQVQHRPTDQGAQSEILLHFNHNVGSTFAGSPIFPIQRVWRGVYGVPHTRVMGRKESGGHLATKMNEDGKKWRFPREKKRPTGLVGKVLLQLRLMKVEKVTEKMEEIQHKPPPDVLLLMFPQNPAWHCSNYEPSMEVRPRTPLSSLESPKEKVFGAGEAGQVRIQQRRVSKSFPSLSSLDKQTCWESKPRWQ